MELAAAARELSVSADTTRDKTKTERDDIVDVVDDNDK